MDPTLSTSEAAAELSMSVRWLERRIEDGTLPAYAWDTGERRVFRVRREDLERFRATHLHLATDLPPRSERVDEEA